jgi:hypothetical protein
VVGRGLIRFSPCDEVTKAASRCFGVKSPAEASVGESSAMMAAAAKNRVTDYLQLLKAKRLIVRWHNQ